MEIFSRNARKRKGTSILSHVSDGLRKYVYFFFMDYLNVTKLLPENLKQSGIMAILSLRRHCLTRILTNTL